MMRSLFSGVSGLKSHQTRMDVIGNNIANINTVGFKSSRVTFSDMLSQTTTGASGPTAALGGTNPKQIGLGAAVASIDLIFNDGSPQSTGKNTDVALSGNGLFVVKSGNNTYYTRDGAFEFDAEGNYVLPGSGYYVQGWNAIEGALNTNAQPTNIVVPAGKTMPASATTQVDFSGNLNASAPIITAITYTGGGGTANPTSCLTGITVETVTPASSTSVSPAAGDSGTTLTVVGTTGFTAGDTVPLVVVSTATSTVDSSVTIVTLGYPDSSTTVGTISTTDTYAVGATYNGVAASDSKDDRDILTLSDGTTEVTSRGTWEVGDVYEADSVNVDGKNVISAVLTLSDGSTQKVTTGFYQVGRSVPITTIVTVYDSEGKTHAVTLLLDKDNVGEDSTSNEDARALGNENRWRAYIAPGEGERGPAVSYRTTEADGSITDGFLNRSLNNSVAYIYFNDDGSYSAAATRGGTLELEYSNGNGAANTTAAISFTGLTQYSGGSTAYPTADGNAFGVLQSVSIDTTGIITGTYTNSVRRFEAQIAVAQFINSSGLTKIGTSLYQESNNSGSANVKTVADLGLTITPAAIEMSNVDLSTELSDMIITQRGFQSNSKIITVADEMLETLINMKR